MSAIPRFRLAGRAAFFVLLGMLSGCASQQQFRSGEQAFAQGDYVQAVQQYRAASDGAPDNVRYRQEFLRKRGEALAALTAQADGYLTSGDLAQAEGAYQQALQIDPNNVALRDRQHALNMRRQHDAQIAHADELIGAGKLPEAERLVSLVLAEDPRNMRALNSKERIEAAGFQRKVDEGLDGRFRKPVTLELGMSLPRSSSRCWPRLPASTSSTTRKSARI